MDGLNDDVVDILGAATRARDRLAGIDVAAFGDPCAGIGDEWESASAVALGLLVADLATSADGGDGAPLTGPAALGWAATSNDDSDSIACIAGAVFGSAHVVPNYWKRAGLVPEFEPRYTAELEAATQRLPGKNMKTDIQRTEPPGARETHPCRNAPGSEHGLSIPARCRNWLAPQTRINA
ncbi:hypothetical protein [Rhodococcus sp. YH3-3]|uniref:hypothetical protein n=1 Tax=Rhodococcus sp. YH3-3 TaxID=1803579 RepID=UPI0007DB1E21|nr:hypothetical protein [Rhodococcus sp. YH3-3]